MKKLILASVSVFLIPSISFAWGRRGHQIVGETAAQLASEGPTAPFLKSHSFDFGYYANVPDFIWKRPATYEFEKPQHFMDMDIFEREFMKKPEIKNPLALSRKEFEAQFPEIKESAGRAFWRIRELNDQLTEVTKKLRDLAVSDETRKERQDLQSKWFVIAGVMAHYYGDLSQPLHVSENYDGEMTGQKGIHAYFEDDAVDELYPDLRISVQREVNKRWADFKKKNANKSILELLQQLVKVSEKNLKPMLDIDKKNKRDPVAKNAKKFEKIIIDSLAEGTLTLAEAYRRQLGWKFDGNRFYFFAGEPEYIRAGK